MECPSIADGSAAKRGMSADRFVRRHCTANGECEFYLADLIEISNLIYDSLSCRESPALGFVIVSPDGKKTIGNKWEIAWERPLTPDVSSARLQGSVLRSRAPHR